MSNNKKYNKILGLYIHIPFCEKKCHYCDFLTFVNKDDKIDKYVEYLIKEIKMYENDKYILDTIYFGGGTPSYLNGDKINMIMSTIREVFIIKDNCEISIEMNPESVNEEKIKLYIKNGFNRFSMGVQSFNNTVLKIMGRLHRKDTVVRNIKLMRSLGCNNISIDLMLANPKQEMNILQKDLEIAMSLGVDHISYYSLILKERTHFELWEKQGKIELFDPNEERQMYHEVVNTLKANNYHQYEISSFSKPGYESIHNQKYWNLKDYIGVGMGASSNMGLIRFTNSRKFDEYFNMIDNNKIPIIEREEMSIEIREKEYIILNMRMTKGFDINNINKKFNINFLEKYKDVINKYIEENIIQIIDNRISFTNKGIDNGNLFYIDIYEQE